MQVRNISTTQAEDCWTWAEEGFDTLTWAEEGFDTLTGAAKNATETS